MFIRDRFHLTYCTNIHPGQDWEQTFSSLREFVPGIRKQISGDAPFGLGLRLSNKASEELGHGERLEEFRQWLADERLYVFTMNGFPYGNFHHERVKDQVHTPDWTTEARVVYSKRLADQLAFLLPEGIHGGISTSPVSYRHWHAPGRATEEALLKGARNLTEMVIHLYGLEKRTGKYIHLDIEPEPDGLLENSTDTIHFFESVLLPVATKVLPDTLGIPVEKAGELLLRYVTLCYDICHFSLAYEEPADTFRKLKSAGIRIGKIQVSAALRILNEAADPGVIWEALSRFDEPTYLHQVTERTGDGVRTYRDLPEVLNTKNDFTELRAHFHVPVFLKQFGVLYSTNDHILKVMDILQRERICEHLEIETYTWEVLPAALKRDLPDSVVREFQWVLTHLGA